MQTVEPVIYDLFFSEANVADLTDLELDFRPLLL